MSNLAGTTWVFKETLTLTTCSCQISDLDENMFVRVGYSSGGYKINVTSSGMTFLPSTKATYSSSTGWRSDSFRYIEFLVEPDTFAPDEATFMTWLRENATQQPSAYYITNDVELGEVADAIRRTMGKSESLVFPTDFIKVAEANRWLDSDVQSVYCGAQNLRNYAFFSCSTLTEAYFPVCTSIGASAFQNCTSLTTASFPACTTIGVNAFSRCSALTTVSFPVCTSICASAFQNCTSLTTASFPVCRIIITSAFQNCTSLTTASFPVCTMISDSAFYSCYSLTTASFPACTGIGNYAFAYCSALTTASFPSCTMIRSYAFYCCLTLTSLYFLGSRYMTAGGYIFSRTAIADSTFTGSYGSIYFRESMLASYKTMVNWSVYSARMVGLTDAQIAALG